MSYRLPRSKLLAFRISCALWFGIAVWHAMPAAADISLIDRFPPADLVCVATEVSPPLPPEHVRLKDEEPFYRFEFTVDRALKGAAPANGRVVLRVRHERLIDEVNRGHSGEFEAFVRNQPYLLFLRYEKGSGVYRLVTSGSSAYAVAVPPPPDAALQGTTPLENLYSLLDAYLKGPSVPARKTALLLLGNLGDLLQDSPPANPSLAAPEEADWLRAFARTKVVPEVKTLLGAKPANGDLQGDAEDRWVANIVLHALTGEGFVPDKDVFVANPEVYAAPWQEWARENREKVGSFRATPTSKAAR